ncbi:UDP-N-acetylmuramoylalanine--D-glutamate ligase [Dongia mobilis]|uniref:UDP-N-acetylmuramoylalanine--D-glutamate ligase n=1 Tax=Dongia mobilis TaxID=578943 RepID=A0A4R6WQU0_9PROT|nr:UDP-N-acetylmuramoyl-L-alanine--D-glutamate ligase [Dongia mobilis]TDQ83962.1 UDP-N-acetylmuramoylalanine--D-glutamate ligase [Dongia mobilis]
MTGSGLHIPNVQGRTIAVLGLGRTGLATAERLQASGARVLAWDDSEKARAAAPAEILHDLYQADWSRIDALVMSPGIPLTHPAPHPVAAAAKAAAKPIGSDIALLAVAQPNARFVGITGTNGKSTTTTLIAHILKSAGKAVEVGGNLGQAALSLQPLGPDGIYVLELSSYQLDLTPSPIADIAILLNISPDHLDRHGGMEGYVASKASILRPKGRFSIGIVGMDDAHCRGIFEAAQDKGRRLVPISAERKLERSIYVNAKGILVDSLQGVPQGVADLNTIPTLPGRHNWQNAAAAYITARALGLSLDQILAGFASYPGLAHRQQLVATIGGIRYVNDSKATNADAAAKALDCYDNIYWIIGGRAKEGGLAGLEGFYPKIRHGFLIGEAASAFEKQIGRAFPLTQCGTLDKAVAAAHAQAQREKRPGAVVLLAPACASWDQFTSFEVRGDRFRELVAALAAKAGGAA